MFHRISQSALLSLAMPAVAAVMVGLALPAGAVAAPKPPTPISNTTCWGLLKPAPIASEPNLLSYQFYCDNPITGYTILGNRRAWDSGVIDDFDTAPLTTMGDGVTPDPTTSWTCEGSIPSNGFNCNAGAGGSMAAWSIVQGTLDTSDPYCGTAAASRTKRPAKRSSARTPTYPPGLQRALVQLVVIDSTGAQDGPFVLPDTASCQLKKSHKHHRHAVRDK